MAKDRVIQGQIEVKDGKILTIQPMEADLEGDNVLDFENAYVVPGTIDVHVHCFSNRKEGFIPTSMSAAAGGIAILLPLYALMILFVYFVGFTEIVEVPGLVGTNGDYALLRLSMKTFDPWFVGIIGATGLLSALVPGSMMLMSTATMLTKNGRIRTDDGL